MENEELITSLIFLEYSVIKSDKRKTLDIFQKTDRLNSRIGDKLQISNLLLELTEDQSSNKNNYDNAHRNVKSFIKKLKYVLLDTHKNKEELFDYLRQELDEIFKANKAPKQFRRTLQDFYFLWYLISEINFEMIKFHRLTIKSEIKTIFNYLKNIPESDYLENQGLLKFNQMVDDFKSNYKISERKINLSENDKLKLIEAQNSLSNISGAPVFLGDDIEVDHEFPISKGGKDEIENLKIVHKDENREKGAKI